MATNPNPLYSKPVTDFIQPTEDVLEFAQLRLKDGYTDPATPTVRVPGLQVNKIHIADRLTPEDLYKSITEAPETFVVYRGSTYADNPRRTLSVSIYNIVKVETSKPGSSKLGRLLLDQTLTLLDNAIVGCTHWRITGGSDEPIEIPGTNYLTYQVTFAVESN